MASSQSITRANTDTDAAALESRLLPSLKKAAWTVACITGNAHWKVEAYCQTMMRKGIYWTGDIFTLQVYFMGLPSLKRDIWKKIFEDSYWVGLRVLHSSSSPNYSDLYYLTPSWHGPKYCQLLLWPFTSPKRVLIPQNYSLPFLESQNAIPQPQVSKFPRWILQQILGRTVSWLCLGQKPDKRQP